MTCQSVDKYLYAYCDNTLSPDIASCLEAHLKDCVKCRNKILLAKLENNLLSEGYGIPELGKDFTQNVMSLIQSKNQPVPRSTRILRRLTNPAHIPKPSPKTRYPKFLLASTVLAAALLIALIVPGLNNIGLKNLDNMTEEQYHKYGITAPEECKTDELNDSSPSIPGTGIINDKKSTGNSDVASITPYQPGEDADAIRTANPRELHPISAQRDARDLGQDNLTLKGKTAEGEFYLQPSNLPADYTLAEIICDSEDTLTFGYFNTLTGQKVTISLANVKIESPLLDNRAALNKPEAAISAKSLSSTHDSDGPVNEQDTNTMNWNLPYKDLSLTITLTGNLSLKELTRIADSIQFKEAQNHDITEDPE